MYVSLFYVHCHIYLLSELAITVHLISSLHSSRVFDREMCDRWRHWPTTATMLNLIQLEQDIN